MFKLLFGVVLTVSLAVTTYSRNDINNTPKSIAANLNELNFPWITPKPILDVFIYEEEDSLAIKDPSIDKREGLSSQSLVLSIEEYLDRCEAIWTAQMVGHFFAVSPYEHHQAAVKWEDDFDEEIKEKIRKNGGMGYVDDDWYYEIANLRALEKYGPDMSLEELGQQWVENNVGVWGSSGLARKNLIKGIPAKWVGHPKYNRVWFTMGAMNRCDLYGMLFPGLPNVAGTIARRLGHINSYAEGTDGGVLMAEMIAMAFYEKNPRTILTKAVNILDSKAPHRQCLELVINMAEAGYNRQECADAVMDKFSLIYPATNGAVQNFGMIAVALWFGDGDFMKTLNMAIQAADYTDADCNAACAVVVLAAMHGMKIIPQRLIDIFGGRTKGKYLGSVEITPPLDITTKELAQRTVEMGLKMIPYWSDGKIIDNKITIPTETEMITQSLELFDPNDFVKYWDPAWKLVRAGYGTPGGGFRGIRGGTFYDADNNLLATYPQNEIRNCYLVRDVKLSDSPSMEIIVGADPGRAWTLEIYVDNEEIPESQQVIDGGEALDWKKEDGSMPWFLPQYFPPPQDDYELSTANRIYTTIEADLSKWKGKAVTIRLYMVPIVWGRYSGNAYWKAVKLY